MHINDIYYQLTEEELAQQVREYRREIGFAPSMQDRMEFVTKVYEERFPWHYINNFLVPDMSDDELRETWQNGNYPPEHDIWQAIDCEADNRGIKLQ